MRGRSCLFLCPGGEQVVLQLLLVKPEEVVLQDDREAEQRLRVEYATIFFPLSRPPLPLRFVA